MITYTGNLDLRWNRDGKTFTVIAPISCLWNSYSVAVPIGFVTDLASIPRLAQGVIPIIEKHIVPDVFHDYCFSGVTNLSFQESNQMYLDGMEAEGVSEWMREEMYRAVKDFGHTYWKGIPIVQEDEPISELVEDH